MGQIYYFPPTPTPTRKKEERKISVFELFRCIGSICSCQLLAGYYDVNLKTKKIFYSTFTLLIHLPKETIKIKKNKRKAYFMKL